MKVIWCSRVLFFYLSVLFLSMIFFTIISIADILNCNYITKYKIGKTFSFCFIFFAKFICGLRYKIYGEQLPSTQAIVMSNHQSFWDNVFMQLTIPMQSWVIKKELLNVPFFGWGLKRLDPIAVNRSAASSVKQILEKGREKLKQGLWLVIFPESTRLKPNQVVNFKPSAAKLAIMCNVPVVLIAHNAGVFWPKGFWIKGPGVIKVKIGPTIYPKNLDARQITEIAQNWINKEKLALANDNSDS